MNITLKNSVLDALDMSYANPTVTFPTNSGSGHFRLLAYLSTLFNNTTFFDIGSGEGGTASALSFNPSNQVHSFDVVQRSCHSRPNVTYHVCNILEDEEWKKKLLEAPLISLDTDPHDGVFEKQFIDYLASKAYKGIVYMDDVFTNSFPALRDYWGTITQKKLNICHYGNPSSAIVLFNPEDEIILQ